MTRYNTLLNSHFRGCELLGTIEDTHRGRTMSVFKLPGEPECWNVGVSDGVECWVAPKGNLLNKMQPNQGERKRVLDGALIKRAEAGERRVIIKKQITRRPV